MECKEREYMDTLTDGFFVTPQNLLWVMEQCNKFVKSLRYILEKIELDAVVQSFEI